jgi:hypothetical protein
VLLLKDVVVTVLLNACPALSRVYETDFQSAVLIEGMLDVAQCEIVFVADFTFVEWIAVSDYSWL